MKKNKVFKEYISENLATFIFSIVIISVIFIFNVLAVIANLETLSVIASIGLGGAVGLLGSNMLIEFTEFRSEYRKKKPNEKVDFIINELDEAMENKDIDKVIEIFKYD